MATTWVLSAAPARAAGARGLEDASGAEPRFFICSSGGWMVVFCRLITHLPSWPRALAAWAAAPICSGDRPVELGRVIHHHRALLGRLQHVLAELGGQRRQILVDLLELGLVGVGQARAGPHEHGLVAVEELGRLGVELELVALLVEPRRPGRTAPGRGGSRPRWADSLGAISVSIFSIASSVLDELRLKNTSETRVRSWPDFSIATMVLSKVAGAELWAMASISLRCWAMPASNAGPKSDVLDLVERRQLEGQGAGLEERVLPRRRSGRRRGALVGGLRRRGVGASRGRAGDVLGALRRRSPRVRPARGEQGERDCEGGE